MSYWSAWVTGVVFVTEQGFEFFVPKIWKQIDGRFAKPMRRRALLWLCAVGFLCASFQAYDDASSKNRANYSALHSAIGERDEARRQRDQNVSPVQSDKINTLSGDLAAARGQIDSQKQQLEKQEGEITAQKAEIDHLKPKPARHLTDDDEKNLSRVFSPLKEQFPTLDIKAPEGEPQAYAKELMNAFNHIGIKVERVGLVFATSDESAPLQVVMKNFNHIPDNAQRFAKAMQDAGFKVAGGQMDELRDEQFILVVARQ